MPFFSLGGANRERVVVTVLRHARGFTAGAAGDLPGGGTRGLSSDNGIDSALHGEHPTGSHGSNNWLAVEVAVWAGSFSAQFPAVFLADDFARFHNALLPLLYTAQGEATFCTREEQLFLRVVANHSANHDGGQPAVGGMEVTGMALAWPGEGQRCEFRLVLDRATLGQTLRELGDIMAAFPVRHAQQVLGF